MRKSRTVLLQSGKQQTHIAHTIGHHDCPACAASDNNLNAIDADLSVLTLSQAVPLWKTIREQRELLKPRTHETTDQYFKQLEKFFGDIYLRKITAGSLREYQLARRANLLLITQSDSSVLETRPWKKPAGNSIINHELVSLGVLLEHCGLWAALKPYYHPLPIASWSPREILSEEQEEHLFKIAFGREDVMLAYCVAAITNNTTAAGCELRGLRLGNLFFREPQLDRDGIDRTPSEFYIPAEAVKNDSRPRMVPMNPTAKWAFQYCYKRALKLGACKETHFLFPFRIGPHHYDPARESSRWWIRDNWDKLRTVAGFPTLRPHDMRHLCITRLFENGANPDDIRSLAGHVNPKMTEYYCHGRRKAKLAAVMLIETGKAGKKKPVRSAPIGELATAAVGQESR